ncbi:MAG: MFS transporter [Pseudomonadota bacterium]
MRSNASWLAAGALLTFSSSYGQTFFISIFAGEIRASFGLTHGQWGLIYTLGTGLSAIVMLWAGTLMDKVALRPLASVVLPLLALACFGMSIAPAAWALLPVIFLLRFAGQGMTSQLATVTMARWFRANRGKALSISALGFAVGEMALPITFVGLLAFVPWRGLWMLAGAMALLALPLLLALLGQARQPQSQSEEGEASGIDGKHWSRPEVIRHVVFWMYVPMLAGISAFVTALFFQQVHLTEIKAWNHGGFVALIPTYTLAAIASMIGSGLIIDRYGARTLVVVVQLPLVAAFAVFGASAGMGGAAIAMISMGLATGANATVPSALWAELYGTRHIGAIKALAAAVMVAGSAIGPGLSGSLIDAGILFDEQCYWIAAYFLLSTVCVGLAAYRSGSYLPERRR